MGRVSDCSYWHNLDQERKIKISPVGPSFVDEYVKNVRKGDEKRGKELSLKVMKKELNKYNK